MGFSSASRGPSRGGRWSGKDWGGKERGRGSRSARGQWRSPGVGSGSSYSGGKQNEGTCVIWKIGSTSSNLLVAYRFKTTSFSSKITY